MKYSFPRKAAVNLSYFISGLSHSPRPWTQDGRPCIHGNTLFQYHPTGILLQEGVSKIACAPRQLKEGWLPDNEEIWTDIFAVLPVGQAIQSTNVIFSPRGQRSRRDGYYMLENLQSNALYAVVKGGWETWPVLFLIYRKCMRKTAVQYRKRESSISFPLRTAVIANGVNSTPRWLH